MDTRWVALIVLTTARITVGIQSQALASVAPFVVSDLGVTYAEMGVLFGLNSIPGLFLAVPGGLLGPRFGDKRVMVAGVLLFIIGAVIAGLAKSFVVLAISRLVSGLGGMLLTVVMTKMTIDWFAGREIVLAMAVFINGFPIGLGIALMVLGPLAETAGWPVSFYVSAVAGLVTLMLVALAYHRHSNDRVVRQATSTKDRISRNEIVLVCVAGAIWGVLNGAILIMLAFTPVFLITTGMTVAEAGLLVGLVPWLSIASTQAGGIIANRWVGGNTLVVFGIAIWGLCLLALPITDPVPNLFAIGLLASLGMGVIVSLPSEVLRPQKRSVGMGIYNTWLYLGFSVLQPIAGWIKDFSGSAAAPIYFAGVLMLSILPLFAAFRLLQARLMRSPQ